MHALGLEAAGAEVNHLDGTAGLVAQKHVLRLEIAVHNLVFVQQLQTLHHAPGQLADKRRLEAAELALPERSIEVPAWSEG